MRRLIQFEYKKHFLNIPIILILILFAVVDGIIIRDQFDQEAFFSKNRGAELRNDFEVLYGEFKGKITDEKKEKLEAIYQKIEDKVGDRTASNKYDPDTITGSIYHDEMLVKKCFQQPMEYNYNYKEYSSQVVQRSLDNIEFYSSIHNLYEKRKNTYIANTFYGRQIDTFAYSEMLSYYFGYHFSSFLAILLCMFGVVGVFVMEKENEMDSLLVTAKRGGGTTVAAKIAASVIYITGIQLFFAVLDFIIFYQLYQPDGILGCPVYIVNDFCNTPLTMTVLQFILLSNLVKWFGFLIFGMIFLLLSGLFRHGLYPIVIGTLIVLVSNIFCDLYGSTGFPIYQILNPYQLIANWNIFRTLQFVRVCNYPVPVYELCLIAGAIWMILFFVLIGFSGKRNIYGRGKMKHAKLPV